MYPVLPGIEFPLRKLVGEIVEVGPGYCVKEVGIHIRLYVDLRGHDFHIVSVVLVPLVVYVINKGGHSSVVFRYVHVD